MRLFLGLSAGLILAACGNKAATPQDAFFDEVSKLCGQAFEGKIVSTDEADADWRKETLIMHVRDCSKTEIKIPLHVGENRSRTWIITKTDNGLRLKHDHRHEDGSSDAVTMYGGDTADAGTASEQNFPVDAESIALFEKEGLGVSVTNVWAVRLGDETFTYQLSRPGRLFQAEFDTTKPVSAPPAVWGYDG
ncbi:MAG: hypothetical protein ACSHXY_12040 [Alphaproteobacteria bacterium]